MQELDTRLTDSDYFTQDKKKQFKEECNVRCFSPIGRRRLISSWSKHETKMILKVYQIMLTQNCAQTSSYRQWEQPVDEWSRRIQRASKRLVVRWSKKAEAFLPPGAGLSTGTRSPAHRLNPEVRCDRDTTICEATRWMNEMLNFSSICVNKKNLSNSRGDMNDSRYEKMARAPMGNRQSYPTPLESLLRRWCASSRDRSSFTNVCPEPFHSENLPPFFFSSGRFHIRA